MCNCYKSVSEFINELPALNEYLSNAENYFAHTPQNDSVEKETLEKHISLVNKYLCNIVKEHSIDPVIDKLINDITSDEETGKYIKRLFVNTIVFHDFGKINELFQVDKMGNEKFRNVVDESPIGSKHSALSAFIYLTKHLNEIVSKNRSNPDSDLITACIYLSYSIFKHHSKWLDDDCLSVVDSLDSVKDFLKKYLQSYNIDVHPNIIKNLIGKNDYLADSKRLKKQNSFSLYALCRLNFSLLTASDYLATNEYMSQKRIDDFGILSKERIDEIYAHITKNDWLNKDQINYNKAVYEDLENYSIQNPKEKSAANLNVLRKEMAIEVVREINKNYNKNLFYIEAPTGGGKTNLSALATIELLKIHEGQYNKVFYVFPFTTLITQTYRSLKNTLGLNENEMIELHSHAGIKMDDEEGAYGSDKLNYINNLFVNYPFTFLSHIRFFDILKTNEKQTNYLLHRMANSIVVIDELQSYNPQHWDKIIYFVSKYADAFNIKFILMSATLPKIGDLNVIKEGATDFVYLLPDAKQRYFNNPNFSKRVEFDFALCDKKNITLSDIADKLISESVTYSKKDFGKTKPPDSVYTIIEFIFKKTASEFYDIITNKNIFFDEVFILSGTILESRRKQIINYLKNKNNRKKKILLITTQVVEAGVDIDMDLGFKDRSLIDSDEQLAGRINRNVNKKDCKLFLFNYNKEAIIYGKDKRWELTEKYINQTAYVEILSNKDFDRLYNIVLNDRNEWNKNDMAVNFSDYETYIKSLKFRSVHNEFKLIDQNNITCFIPTTIPVEIEGQIEGEKEKIFTDLELALLNKYQIKPNIQNEIEGEKVFDLYLALIHNKRDLIRQKTQEKILQGIMSKFVVSMFATNKLKEQLTRFSDMEKSEYGYMYISGWQEFYDIKTGISEKDFSGIETQFI